MLALFARHMTIKATISQPIHQSKRSKHLLAPSVLLNRTLTVTALLRITLDPVRSLTIVATLPQPHLRHSAHDRPMIIFNRTPKTKLVLLRREPQRRPRLFRTIKPRHTPRAARHSRHNRRQAKLGRRRRARHRVRAARVRAVLELLFRPHKVAHEQLLKPRPDLRIFLLLLRVRREEQNIADKRVRRRQLTPLRHAPHHVFAFVPYLGYQVHVPARGAERVAAVERERRDVGRVVVAYGAGKGFPRFRGVLDIPRRGMQQGWRTRYGRGRRGFRTAQPKQSACRRPRRTPRGGGGRAAGSDRVLRLRALWLGQIDGRLDEHLGWVIHVFLNQALLVPRHMSQKEGGGASLRETSSAQA